jgi:hypothetical protein
MLLPRDSASTSDQFKSTKMMRFGHITPAQCVMGIGALTYSEAGPLPIYLLSHTYPSSFTLTSALPEPINTIFRPHHDASQWPTHRRRRGSQWQIILVGSERSRKGRFRRALRRDFIVVCKLLRACTNPHLVLVQPYKIVFVHLTPAQGVQSRYAALG